jgi:hypothetical protein
VDHIVPLECGGADVPSNLQWQTVQEAKIKGFGLHQAFGRAGLLGRRVKHNSSELQLRNLAQISFFMEWDKIRFPKSLPVGNITTHAAERHLTVGSTFSREPRA